MEAGWEGETVIEIGNATNLPVKVYTGTGIAQFMFFRGNVPCETSYGDRNGKYQGQTGITLSKV
jgi:dCTP deaminase